VNVSEILLLAATMDVTFSVEDGRLAYRAPSGAMTGELRAEIIAHKAEIISLLQRNHVETASRIPRADAADTDDAPLASGQERLWLIERRMGASALYNIHFRLAWQGVLDREALALSLRDLAGRHDAMRTAISTAGGVPQAVASADPLAAVTYLDARGLDRGAVQDVVLDQQRTPFDLERGPLLRITVVTLADEDHLLLVTQHHICTDGWSLRIFLTELGQAYLARYRGQRPALPDLPLRYSDYTRWEHAWRAEQAYQERLTWWKEHLAGLTPLVMRQPRRAGPGRGEPDHTGAVTEFSVPGPLLTALKDLASAEHCTLYTVLLSAWVILLHRQARQADFAVGTVTSGRDRAELAGLIGFFANTVVIRCDLSGNPSVSEAISRLRAETAAVFEHEVPFTDIVLAADAVRDTSLTPLIQAAFMFPNLPAPRFLSGQEAQEIGAEMTVDARIDGSVLGTTKFDLSMTVQESDDELNGYIEYATAQFGDAFVQRLASHFRTLLESITRDPGETIGRIKIIDAKERQRILSELSGGTGPDAR
jgi:hypothetical protein